MTVTMKNLRRRARNRVLGWMYYQVSPDEDHRIWGLEELESAWLSEHPP